MQGFPQRSPFLVVLLLSFCLLHTYSRQTSQCLFSNFNFNDSDLPVNEQEEEKKNTSVLSAQKCQSRESRSNNSLNRIICSIQFTASTVRLDCHRGRISFP